MRSMLLLLLLPSRLSSLEYLLHLHNGLIDIAQRSQIVTPAVPQACPSNAWCAKDTIEAAIIGAALGDAVGRITEKASIMYYLKRITKSADEISLKWALEQGKNKEHGTLFYTDDTIMALPVLERSLLGRVNKLDPEAILSGIASDFIFWVDESNDPYYEIRFHGGTAPAVVKKLVALNNQTQKGWWKSKGQSWNWSCGSVMRVWPIGLVFDDLKIIKKLAREQSLITHGHITAQAACVAMAVGMYWARKDLAPLAIARKMVEACEECEQPTKKFDFSNVATNPGKVFADFRQAIKDNAAKGERLSATDFLQYVIHVVECSPEFKEAWAQPGIVLGNDLAPASALEAQTSGRSQQGGLLGWVGDEAVAAALYLFLRNAKSPTECNTWRGIQEAAWTVGDSDTIATLTGALLGAYGGLVLSGVDNASYIDKLENYQDLRALAAYATKVLQNSTNPGNMPSITEKRQKTVRKHLKPTIQVLPADAAPLPQAASVPQNDGERLFAKIVASAERHQAAIKQSCAGGTSRKQAEPCRQALLGFAGALQKILLEFDGLNKKGGISDFMKEPIINKVEDVWADACNNIAVFGKIHMEEQTSFYADFEIQEYIKPFRDEIINGLKAIVSQDSAHYSLFQGPLEKNLNVWSKAAVQREGK